MALVIFDLDGTLLDSIEGLAISMNIVLNEFNLEGYTIERYKGFVGNGIRMLVERALGDEKQDIVEEALERMIHHYRSHYMEGMRAYDGIYPLLDVLVKDGHRIALVTNKFQFMADLIMEDFFSEYPFVKIIGRSEEHPAKPDPTTILEIITENAFDKADTFMVGDTEVDLSVASNAGINEVFVTWGFRQLEEVRHFQPKTVIERPDELLAVIHNMTNE